MAEKIVNNQTYLFLNYETRKVIDLTGGAPGDTIPVISHAPHCTNFPNNQLWRAVAVDSQFFTLVNVQSGTVLDLAYGNKADGTLIQGFHGHGSANQQWQFQVAYSNTGGDTPAYFIQNRASQSMVCIKDGALANGVQLVGWTWTSNGAQVPNMRWIAIPVQPQSN